MHKLVYIFLCFTLLGCATGDLVPQLGPGMSQEQVVNVLGKPDGFKQRGEYKIYIYTNRLISGWSWDRTDYTFIFKENQLVEYGPGEVRERNVGGVHTFFIHQM